MMLRVEHLETFYGESQVLFGMDLEVDAGEVVTLLGRNGMGKTTTVRSIMGLTRPRAGRIWFEDAEITGLPSYKVARAGLGLVPEGRQIFANLTLRENLVATARGGANGGAALWTLDRVFELFPALAERAKSYGDQLSGGEQQMLSIGRALLTNPELLILDEATEGLAPLIRREIWAVIRGIKKAGIATIVVDKDVNALLSVSDQCLILAKGRVVFSGSAAELAENPETHRRYLGV
jgi:branched-chain amino acid transport system ATP-binding protein